MNASSTNETISTTKDVHTYCARSLRYGLSQEPPPLANTHAILVVLDSPQSNNRTAGVPPLTSSLDCMAILEILGRPQSYARTVGSATHVQMRLQSSLDCKWFQKFSAVKIPTIGLQDWVGGRGVQFGLQSILEILGSPQSNDRTAGFPPHVQFGL